MATVATDQDREHLARALALAERGRDAASPNPLVGAVIARDGEVLGEGWHAAAGELHAERAALADCATRGHDARGATFYVTLEPCAHHGRQPPCTDALLEAGVKRVVYASDDPSEKANGRGPGILRDGGVEVEAAAGPEAAAARLQNQPFRKHARTGRPLVVHKAAMSLDGRTASTASDSRWISGAESRALVHRWRSELDAIAVGIGTALADDPLLTARPGAKSAERPVSEAGPQKGATHQERVIRQPTRVVFDSKARLPLDSQSVQTVAEAPLVVVHTTSAPRERVAALLAAGVETISCDGDAPARIQGALSELGRREITSLLLEGGATLAGAFADAGEIDELRFFIAPVLIGGADARPVVGGAGSASVGVAPRALATEWERSGEDLLVRARLREW